MIFQDSLGNKIKCPECEQAFDDNAGIDLRITEHGIQCWTCKTIFEGTNTKSDSKIDPDNCDHKKTKWTEWTGTGVDSDTEKYLRRSGKCPECDTQFEQSNNLITQVYKP